MGKKYKNFWLKQYKEYSKKVPALRNYLNNNKMLSRNIVKNKEGNQNGSV